MTWQQMTAEEIAARASLKFAKREWDEVPRVDRERRMEEAKFIFAALNAHGFQLKRL